MKLLRLNSALHWLCIACLTLAVGCSGATQFGGKKDKDDSKGDDDGNEEDDELDDPEQISGAFLTCGLDETRSATANATPIGCSLVDEEKQKVVDKTVTYDLELRDQTDTPVPMKTQSAPEDSKWLVLGLLPNSFKTNGRLIMLALAPPQSVGTIKDDGDPESEAASQFSGAFDTADIFNPPANDPEKLRSLQFQAYWNPGNNIAWTMQAINTNDFCDAQGNINKTLTVESAAAVGAIEPPVSVKITSKVSQIKRDTSACFKMFSSMFNSGKGGGRYQQGAGGCYFFRIQDKEKDALWIMSPLAASSQGVTPAQVEEFSEALKCPAF